MDKKKIMVFVDDYSGGAGNIAQLLALRYSHQNEVTLVLMNHHSEPRYDLSAVNLLFVDSTMDLSRPHTLFSKGVLPVRKAIQRIKPDVVLSFVNNINTLCCMASIGLDVPVVVSERNDPRKKRPKLVWDVLRSIFYLRADAISVQFSSFRGFLRYGDKKTFVTPNMILKSDAKARPEELHNPVRLVAAGRLVEQKRFDIMIESFSRLRDLSSKEYVLTIYGEGSLRGELEAVVKSSHLEKNILLPGSTTNIHRALSEADIFLLSSDWEGFPNVLGEAMAVGLPIVAMRCHDGIPELLGEAAIVVESRDVVSFAETIANLTNDIEARCKMSEAGIRNIENYSEEIVMDDWEKCLNYAMSKRGKIAGIKKTCSKGDK